jgi:hypothetical protein
MSMSVQEKVPLAHVSIAALDDTDDIENAFQVSGAKDPRYMFFVKFVLN